MTRPILITKPGCPFAERTRIVLAMLDIAHDVRVVDVYDKPDWFRALSPLGKAPVLVDGDETLFESTAINEYLIETRGAGSGLIPAAPADRARMRAWVQVDETALTPAFYRLLLAEDPSVRAKARDAYLGRRDVLAHHLETGVGPFLLGATATLADVTLYTHLTRWPVLAEGRGVPPPAGALRRWLTAMAALDGVSAAAAPPDVARADLAPYLDASVYGDTRLDMAG